MININDLPNEILRHLIQYLSHREVKTLGKTCQRMSVICEESMESRRKAVYIKASWRNPAYSPPLEDILNAASLARRGFLTAVGNMNLSPQKDNGRFVTLDISRIPAVELVQLSKCVKDGVNLWNVTGDLSPILNNINCERLRLEDLFLNTANTQSLVRAMISRVKTVRMFWIERYMQAWVNILSGFTFLQ